MLTHLQLDRTVLARIDTRAAREHEEKIFRPTAVTLVVSPAGVLMVESAKSRRWGPPQGGIERGESVIMALFRELGEETGIEASVVKGCRFSYATRLLVPGGRDGFALGKSYYFFRLECHTVPKVELQKEEVSAFQWLELPDVGDFLTDRASPQKVHATLTAFQKAFSA